MENEIFAPTGEGKRSDCTKPITVMVIIDMPGIGSPDEPIKDES